jgi:hypothetical protein
VNRIAGALEVVSGRMASWTISEVEMGTISAELLVLDDAVAGTSEVKLMKANDVTFTLTP